MWKLNQLRSLFDEICDPGVLTKHLLVLPTWGFLNVLALLEFEGVEGDEQGTREGILAVVIVHEHGQGWLVITLGLAATPIA